METNVCFYHLDGNVFQATDEVRVTYGSFFRVVVSQREDSDHDICSDMDIADNVLVRPSAAASEMDTTFLVQTYVHLRPTSDDRLSHYVRSPWVRATIWLHVRSLQDQCQSFPTTVMFRKPPPFENSWEDEALRALADSIPRHSSKQNAQEIHLIEPQPRPLARTLGLVQLLALDYALEANDVPFLIDIVGLDHLDRTVMHYWTSDAWIYGTSILDRRQMTQTCHQQGWCFFRIGEREFQTNDALPIKAFAFVELIFVPTPIADVASSECDTLTPSSGSDSASLSLVDTSSTQFDPPPDLDEHDDTYALSFIQLSFRSTSIRSQSEIVWSRLPPPGNGQPSKTLRFNSTIEVWECGSESPILIEDHKMTNPFLCDFVCTTDEAADNPFVLQFMRGLGWSPLPTSTSVQASSNLHGVESSSTSAMPVCSSGLTLCLDRLIPPSASTLPLDSSSKHIMFGNKRPSEADVFPDLPLPEELDFPLGTEIPWASGLCHSTEGLDLHPFTRLALELCPPTLCTSLRTVHVYTDGSFLEAKVHEGEYHPSSAAWSFVALGELSDGSFTFIGYLTGDVILETDPRWETAGIGATRADPLTAERCALYWAVAWGHHLATTASSANPPSLCFHFDCLAAGWDASGAHGPTLDSMSALAIALRALAIRLATKVLVDYRHIHGHCGHPWNEFADTIARSRAKKQIPDCTPLHFLSTLRTNTDFLLWSTSREAAPTGFDSREMHSLWLRGFDSALPDDYEWTPFSKAVKGAPNACMFRGMVASYNVMTLKKRGALELLRSQCDRKGLHVVGLQETRDRSSQFWTQGSYFRFTSAADKDGQGGIQLWVHRENPFLFHQGKPVHLTAKSFTVVCATPRFLRVHCHVGGIHLVFLVGHAPHSTSPDSSEWWASTIKSCHDINQDAHQILMIDANCRLAGFDDEYIGPHGPYVDPNHQDASLGMHELLAQQSIFVPSTFEKHHRGSHYTWTLGQGNARLDYVGLPTSWRQSVSTWVEHDIRSGVSEWDHSMLIAQVKADFASLCHYPPRVIRYDREAMKTCTGKAICKQIFADAPHIPHEVNPTLHCHLLEKYLQQALVHHFPFSRRRKKKQFLGDDTYAKVLELRSLRRLQRNYAHQHHRQSAFQLFFLWKSHTAGLRRGCRQHAQQLSVKLCPLLRDIDIGWALLLRTQLQTNALLRSLLKRDHMQNRTRLAHELAIASPTTFFEALKPLLPKHRRGLHSAQKLPGICDNEGRPSTSAGQTARIFQEYYGQSEDGIMISPAELLGRCLQDQRRDVQDIIASSHTLALEDLPTIQQIEAKFRRLAANKAPGPDQLPPELFRNDPQGASLSYFGLFLKTAAYGAEPIQWKGGTVKALFKKGDASQAKNWRNILLASIPGKVAHSSLRDALNRAFQAGAHHSQFGGRRNASIQVPTLAVRAFQNMQKAKGISCALLFVDGIEAFYRMIREVCFHFPSLNALQERLRTKDIPESKLQAILAQAADDSSMHRLGITDHLEKVLKAVHSNTWFILEGEQEQVCATRSGSRPGDPLADICFNVVMRRAIQDLDEVFITEGLANSINLPADSPVPFPSLQNRDYWFSSQAWVDDLIFMLADPQPDVLLQKIRRATVLVHRELASLGIELNMSAGKTEVLLCLRGKGSRALRRSIAFDQSGFITLDPSGNLQPLHSTPKYRYLGSILSHNGGCIADIRHRTAQTFVVLKALRKPVFANPQLDASLKSRALHSIVLSKFMATAGSWCLQTDAEHRAFRNALMRIYRYVHNAWYPAQGKVRPLSNHEVADAIGALYPEDWLAIHSLRSLVSIVRIAPEFVWALLLQDKIWMTQMNVALEWLKPVCFPFPGSADMELDLHMTVEAIAHDHQGFKRTIAKAQKAYLAHRLRIRTAAQWTDQFCDYLEGAHALQPYDPSSQALPSQDLNEGYLCGICGHFLTTFRSIKVHLHRKHQVYSDSFQWAQATRCEVCLLEFHQKRRLQLHFEHGGQACLLALQRRYREPPPAMEQHEGDASHLPFVRVAGPIAPWYAGVPEQQGVYLPARESNRPPNELASEELAHGDSHRLRKSQWTATTLPDTIFWPVKVILHLFSGRRRPGDLQQWLECHATVLQCQIAVLSLDVAVDADHGDLSKPSTQRYWVLRTLDGYTGMSLARHAKPILALGFIQEGHLPFGHSDTPLASLDLDGDIISKSLQAAPLPTSPFAWEVLPWLQEPKAFWNTLSHSRCQMLRAFGRIPCFASCWNILGLSWLSSTSLTMGRSASSLLGYLGSISGTSTES